MSTSTYLKPFRRRAEGRTNYTKRLAFLKSGFSRAVIRKSTNHMNIQCVKSTEGKDKIIAAAHTKELGKFSYNGHGGNIPAAYLTGLLAGKRMLKKDVKEIIVDLGVQPPVLGTRLFAAVKGIQDAGVTVHADTTSFPKEGRLTGKHIEEFAQHASSKTNTNQFSTYAGKKIDTRAFTKTVELAKKEIMEGGNA
ncbi:MAG: 50S ribosomal protein L18 [Candidatus Diapherotrites archaeon]